MILLLFVNICFAVGKPVVLDSIVAKVNDQIITNSSLIQRANQFASQLKAEKIKLPSRPEFLSQVLEMMITETLQLQMAQRAGITVSDTEVQQAINGLAQEQHVTNAQMKQSLTKHGVSYKEFVKNIKDQLTVQKLQKEAVVAQVTISPAEVNAYLHSALNSNKSLYLYHVEDILISVSSEPTPMEIQAAKQKADDILMQLKTGANFRTLAVAQSSGQQAMSGGDLGWRSLAELPTIFAQQIAHMQTGGLAGPIHTANGFHIIHLIGIKRNPTIPSDKALKDRVSQMLYRQKVEEKLQIWIQQLRAQAYVKILLPGNN